MTVKFNVQMIYLSIYYIYFINLFIVLICSTIYMTVKFNIQLIVFIYLSYLFY